LQLEEVATPTPAADEVLVRVRAASVNPIDFKIRSGQAGRASLPAVLGRDIAGTIEATGAEVSAFRQGDAVFALLDRDHGGYAEYVIVKARDLARKPERLDFVEAAAVPLAAITAWQGLFDQGALQSGELVLIHGGAGGVGHFAVQLAKAKGARVATTVAAQDVAFMRELGADQVIDYQHQRFEGQVRDVDLVFDLVGGDTQERSWVVLKRGGRMVSTLTQPSEERARALGVRVAHYTAKPNAQELAAIARLIDEGKVRPHIERIYPLASVREAQVALEHGHTQGKIVLNMAA
jgi:NADPH:quinone reductase-like Zn-dependent oxidoreductase